jgi:recombinational DNA repair protein (RecF pathway)
MVENPQRQLVIDTLHHGALPMPEIIEILLFLLDDWQIRLGVAVNFTHNNLTKTPYINNPSFMEKPSSFGPAVCKECSHDRETVARLYHELKTPLTAMKLFAELNQKRLQNERLTIEQIQQMLKINLEQIERMESWIKSVT